MNLTRQVHLTFIEWAAARTRLRSMDALTKIKCSWICIRASRVLPGRQRATESLALCTR
jgi:hypothetical protein